MAGDRWRQGAQWHCQAAHTLPLACTLRLHHPLHSQSANRPCKPNRHGQPHIPSTQHPLDGHFHRRAAQAADDDALALLPLVPRLVPLHAPRLARVLQADAGVGREEGREQESSRGRGTTMQGWRRARGRPAKHAAKRLPATACSQRRPPNHRARGCGSAAAHLGRIQLHLQPLHVVGEVVLVVVALLWRGEQGAAGGAGGEAHHIQGRHGWVQQSARSGLALCSITAALQPGMRGAASVP